MNYHEKLNEMRNYSIDMNAKVNHGEVFTPINIIEEMLDCFDKNDWGNPNLKWLDPANGSGNFAICIINRLMIGLKNYIIDDNERFKYIIENMIYVCEIQNKNNEVYKSLFQNVNLNIYETDFLKYNFDIKFDRIVGNPPYQEMDGGFGPSAKPIYNLFLEKAIEISNDNAQIMFITPSRWFSGGKGLDKLFDVGLYKV
jgi:site-specific DNA-methyltransferase (adenine-specific)